MAPKNNKGKALMGATSSEEESPSVTRYQSSSSPMSDDSGTSDSILESMRQEYRNRDAQDPMHPDDVAMEAADPTYRDVVENVVVRVPLMRRVRGSTPVVRPRGPPYAPRGEGAGPSGSDEQESGESDSVSETSSLGLFGLQPSSADEARSAQVAADAAMAQSLQEQESAEERRLAVRARERAQQMEDAAQVRAALMRRSASPRSESPTYDVVRRADLACFQRLRRSATIPREIDGILQESEFSLTGPSASEADDLVEMTPAMQAREKEAQRRLAAFKAEREKKQRRRNVIAQRKLREQQERDRAEALAARIRVKMAHTKVRCERLHRDLKSWKYRKVAEIAPLQGPARREAEDRYRRKLAAWEESVGRLERRMLKQRRRMSKNIKKAAVRGCMGEA
eukprot:jgi/Mesvir1/17549/Mv08798-RA.1